MNTIKLNDDFYFAIENSGNKTRLVVYNSGVENVCRKEAFARLKRFTTSDEKKLFGGRLRLHKNIAGIAIEVKGKIEGIIKVDDFLKLLSDAG